MRWGQLCGNLNIIWHCLSLGLEWKLNFPSLGATAEFSKFAGILGVAFSRYHLLWFRLLLFTWPRTSMLIQIKQEFSRLPVYSVSRNIMIDYPVPWFCMRQTTLLLRLCCPALYPHLPCDSGIQFLPIHLGFSFWWLQFPLQGLLREEQSQGSSSVGIPSQTFFSAS